MNLEYAQLGYQKTFPVPFVLAIIYDYSVYPLERRYI